LARADPHQGSQRWRLQGLLTRDGHQVWATSGMTEDELIRHLRELDCHVTDIGDAFELADPGWIARQTD
jgi:hypothetical protein